jgi:hypothetical protein
MLGWAQCGFHKKRAQTRYVELVFLHPVGSAGHVGHFGASGQRIIDKQFFHAGIRPVRIPQKARRHTLR